MIICLARYDSCLHGFHGKNKGLNGVLILLLIIFALKNNLYNTETSDLPIILLCLYSGTLL